jgi:predicted ATPase
MSGAPLIGRDDDLATVLDLLDDHRLVTITGPGGVGKSRLAAEIAARQEAIRPGAVRVAALAGVPRGADVDVLCGRLDLRTPEALALSLPEHSLLVIDDCEHVADGVADLVDRALAANHHVSVLVTAREPLGLVEERLVVLRPLGLAAPEDGDDLASPAVQLFYERAEAAGATWPRDAATAARVAELCRRVDALPLAIELAAPRARSLGPADLLALMDHRLEVLEPTGRQRGGRTRSMSAAIEVSVALLDEHQRQLLQRLAVLPNPFDADLVQVVLEDELGPVEVVRRLGELVDRSLLVATTDGPTRYHLLELVRDYAAEDLRAAGGWETANERLVDAMADEADALVAAGLQQWSGDVIGRIVARSYAFIASIAWCTQHDDGPERALRLLLPLFGGVHQSRNAEIRATGERIVARWPDAHAPLQAEGLALLATGAAVALDASRAESLAADALADPDISAVGQVLSRRALVLAGLARGDVPAALEHARSGRQAAAAVPLPSFARELLAFEASLLDRQGSSDAARETAERAISESDEAHDHVTELFARLVAATVAARAGSWDAVRPHLDVARSLASVLDQAWRGGSVFRSVTVLGVFEAAERAATLGWEASVPWWIRAIDRCAERGEMAELGLTLQAAAQAAAGLGRADLVDDLLAVAVPVTELVVIPSWFGAVTSTGATRAPDGRPLSLVGAVQAAVAAIAASAGPLAGVVAGQAAPADRDAALARDGDGWSITFDGTTARVRDLKGIGDLAQLLPRPGTEVHCLELMGAVDADSAVAAIDDQARDAYRARILDLQGDIDDARAANDGHRAERAELELDALVTELSSALGLGGRARSTGSSAERARSAVTYRIRAALKKLEAAHPAAGRHLHHSVRTGTWCSYAPEHPVTWSVRY